MHFAFRLIFIATFLQLISMSSPRAEDWGENKSLLVPLLDNAAYVFLLNQFNRNFLDDKERYRTDWSTAEENLTHRWVIDDDRFVTNQLLHPYAGLMYHGFARSAGHGYWASLGYTHAGSFFWEIAGEDTPPSVNDQISTGFSGSFLGEAVFRLASLILEENVVPGVRRELATAALSPSTGFNRLAYGDRFDAVFPSRKPAVSLQAAAGIRAADHVPDENISPRIERTEATAEVDIEYGIPGKTGYRHTRPFDYFHFHLSAASATVFDRLTTYGWLTGQTYSSKNGRGIWGFYGGYDYIAPQVFRLSTTSLALGSTFRWRPGKNLTLQSSALVGGAYGMIGAMDDDNERDYHHGGSPRGSISLLLNFSGRIAAKYNMQAYYFDQHNESFVLHDLAVTWLFRRSHGISLKVVETRRNASDAFLAEGAVRTIGLSYIFSETKNWEADL